MIMDLRAWWWARVRGTPEEMPRDVREYVIRRDLKATIEGATTLEEKRDLSTRLMSAAMSLENDQIGSDLRDELVAASFRVLDGVPLSKCAICGGAVFVQEAVKIEGTTYCKACDASLAR